jgi:hypothetical protein
LIDNEPYSSNISSTIDFKSFPHLTELFIDDGRGMHFTRPEPMPIHRFDSIIDDCTFLKSLHFNSGHFGTNNEPIDLSLIKVKPNVKKLSATTVITTNGTTLPFIQHKFPRLEKLYLISKDR